MQLSGRRRRCVRSWPGFDDEMAPVLVSDAQRVGVGARHHQASASGSRLPVQPLRLWHVAYATATVEPTAVASVTATACSLQFDESSSSILNIFKDSVFANEDSANEKYFYTLIKVEKESGIKDIESFKELLLAFQSMFEKRDENYERKKVVMLDEIPASFLFKDQSLNNAFDFQWNPHIYVAGCVSPVI